MTITCEVDEKGKRKLPPCRAACPADVNVQGYMALIQQGRFKESVELIRKAMPFPAICGRVCFSPCQDACTRKEIDQPVSVRNLKRLAADIEREQGRVHAEPVPKVHYEKIAIIGAGPAGLSAAYELAKLGYPVTVFERMSKCGGMMTYGIPDYRLQKYVVANEIEYIRELGVEIRTGAEFNEAMSLDILKSQGFKAIFLAIGAQLSRKLGVQGEDLPNVFHAVEFLRNLAIGKFIKIGEKVAVIGGGNSAIDSARTSLRLGAKEVTILYRRSREEMPALPDEVEAAKNEGIKFKFLVTPKKFVEANGKVGLVECFRMKLGEPDKSGRRHPIIIEGSEHTYEASSVIVAIGQLPETNCIAKLLDEHSQKILVDQITLETKIPGVFAGGDIATGPASVIEAIGAGKRAAVSIDRYITGKDLKVGRYEKIEETTWVKDSDEIEKKPVRYKTVSEDVGRSNITFEESAKRLTELKKLAMIEARRCLECGPCTECLKNEGLCDADKAIVEEDLCVGCNICVEVCSFDAIKKDEMGIAQIDEDLCKGCGKCCASCPEHAITMEHSTDIEILTKVKIALESAS
jgi:heterodisulfide reductase subunit A